MEGISRNRPCNARQSMLRYFNYYLEVVFFLFFGLFVVASYSRYSCSHLVSCLVLLCVSLSVSLSLVLSDNL